jgi:hypothetical protein
MPDQSLCRKRNHQNHQTRMLSAILIFPTLATTQQLNTADLQAIQRRVSLLSTRNHEYDPLHYERRRYSAASLVQFVRLELCVKLIVAPSLAVAVRVDCGGSASSVNFRRQESTLRTMMQRSGLNNFPGASASASPVNGVFLGFRDSAWRYHPRRGVNQ